MLDSAIAVWDVCVLNPCCWSLCNEALIAENGLKREVNFRLNSLLGQIEFDPPRLKFHGQGSKITLAKSPQKS